MIATVIIPAHNEAGVIARTLGPLAAAIVRGELEVIVVCNACTDDTARIAAGFVGVQVISTDVASKTHAMNLGDDHASGWPRIYLDADIVATPTSILDTARLLAEGPFLAARPPARYDTDNSAALVRSYYRARSRVPSLHQSLWGAGVYALSARGHERIGRFPDIKGDDLWVDRSFARGEKMIVPTRAVVVRAPRTMGALRSITRRNVGGSREPAPSGRPAVTSSSTIHELARSIRGPFSAFDAAVYAILAASARFNASRTIIRWERDDTSRV